MLITNSFLYDLIGILFALLAITIAYFKWSFSYWKRKGLDSLDPSIPFGNTTNLHRKSVGEIWKDIYFEMKYNKGFVHGGAYFFAKPIYVPVDTQLIKNSLLHFLGHGFYVNDKADPLSVNLLNLDGPRWRMLRSKLSPTFTSGKMKMMFGTLVECSKGLKDLLQEFSETNAPVNIKDVLARFTTDSIGSCAFGIECNSMKNSQSEFRVYGLKSLAEDAKSTIKGLSTLVFPHSILRFFNFTLNDADITNFFRRIVEETIRHREENNIIRKDFMQLLIQMKNNGTIDDDEKIDDKKAEGKLSISEIAAQCFLFFVGGFDTSSTTLTFASYELALNSDVQDKLREEIFTVLEKHENKLTYDAMMEMSYLDKVLCETLRKHPPFMIVTRVCTKDHKLPDSDVVLNEGTMTVIPVLGIHHDPEYYPDPETFDPERFNEENKAKRPQFTWLPFGDGPRICIGARFAMMQMKVALITLLRNFKLSLNKRTKPSIVYKKTGLVATSEEVIWIDVDNI